MAKIILETWITERIEQGEYEVIYFMGDDGDATIRYDRKLPITALPVVSKNRTTRVAEATTAIKAQEGIA